MFAGKAPDAGKAEVPVPTAEERLNGRGPVLLPWPVPRLEALGVNAFELLEVVLDELVERARARIARPKGDRSWTGHGGER
jgi:hypothetical protein